VFVRQGDEAAARRGRAADHVREDVDAAHTLERRLSELGVPLMASAVVVDDSIGREGLQHPARQLEIRLLNRSRSRGLQNRWECAQTT
jgi:hypothetical protein